MSDLRILVVDDEDVILGLMKRFFAKRGDACMAFANGLEALHAMEDHIFDVMLCDINMPEIDGLELVRRAKQLQPNMACILISGLGTRLDMISALKVGVFDFVDKPIVDLAAFTMVVDRAGSASRLAQDRDSLLENLKEQNTRLEFSLLRLHEAFGQLRQQEEALESDLLKAQRVQRKFLPAGFPQVEGLDLFGYFGPCEHLGGDFFGVIPLSDGRQAVYLIDVAGHGVSAAIITVTLRELMRTPQRGGTNTEMHAAPDQVLAFMSEALRAEAFDPPIYVTMLYAVFDPISGRVCMATAGHPPPMLVTREGEKQLIHMRGPVLGGPVGGRFELTELMLNPGDVLLFYSDGLSEARNDTGIEFTPDRLHDVVVAHHDLTAAGIGDAIEQEMRLHLGSLPAADDMSYIVARRPSSLPQARARLSTGPERIDPRSVKIVSPTTLRFLPRQRQGRIMGGWRDRACIIRLGGVVTWQLASSFREMMKKAKTESASGIQIDLAECEVMDSTMLGVLLQYAGDLTLHQAGRRVMEQLREMGVDGQFEFSHEPCSSFEAPIAIEPTESKEACSELILSAHEALMEASASNRLRFGDVVAALRPSEDTDR